MAGELAAPFMYLADGVPHRPFTSDTRALRRGGEGEGRKPEGVAGGAASEAA
jgi:hypothetical protein